MRKFLSGFLLATIFLSLGASLFIANNAFAIQTVVDTNKTGNDLITDSLQETNEGIGYGTSSLQDIIVRAVKFVLALLGMIMLVIVVYAGFTWMTSGGNPEKVDKAKKWLVNSVIGLILIFAAYSIADFAVQNIAQVTTGS